jgi:hypothetical protein
MERKNDWKRGAFRLRVGDWILLFLALCGVCLGAWYLRGHAEETARTVQVLYTIRMPATDSEHLPTMEEWVHGENGAVTDESGRRSMGTLLKMELRPQKIWTVKDGDIVTTEVPGKVIPEMTVRAEARLIGERELRIGELRLAAGMIGDFIVCGILVRNGEVLWVEEEE